MSDFELTSPVPVGGRESNDHYPTPRWCTLALVEHVHRLGGPDWTTLRTVLDPAAGEGAILDVLHERGFETYGLELDPGRAEAARDRGHKMGHGDALTRSWPRTDFIVMNPPYSWANHFVQKAIEHQRFSAGRTYALLRLSFLEQTTARRAVLRAYTPDVLILPKRPVFDGKGTDSVGSAWFCWPGSGRLLWLPGAP